MTLREQEPDGPARSRLVRRCNTTQNSSQRFAAKFLDVGERSGIKNIMGTGPNQDVGELCSLLLSCLFCPPPPPPLFNHTLNLLDLSVAN